MRTPLRRSSVDLPLERTSTVCRNRRKCTTSITAQRLVRVVRDLYGCADRLRQAGREPHSVLKYVGVM